MAEPTSSEPKRDESEQTSKADTPGLTDKPVESETHAGFEKPESSEDVNKESAKKKPASDPLSAGPLMVIAVLLPVVLVAGVFIQRPSTAADLAQMHTTALSWLDFGAFTAEKPAEGPRGERRIIQLSAWKPRAYLYKGFLSDAECDHLVSLAKPRLERSEVTDSEDGHSEVSAVRTSSGMFLDKAEDAVVRAIEDRISLWTFLPVENQESLQILRYGVGQQYEAHHDYFDDPVNTQQGGHRFVTVLMYLNNVTRGGETTFPEHKDPTPKDDSWTDCAKGVLAVKPVRGDALLFYNLHPDGSVDPSSLHHACPVEAGEKWSAPKWIHVHNYDSPAAGTRGGLCVDSNGLCEAWASMGECETNRPYMIGTAGNPGACRKACNACGDATAEYSEDDYSENAEGGDSHGDEAGDEQEEGAEGTVYGPSEVEGAGASEGDAVQSSR
ncbi:hypothetical protein CLOM_g16579 [Closterium sp. NIES-68]|nr:hypothetical protein CLOM_g16579 [Closterium sp. NIES-68]GJP69325.1 hypothetical protein CLOP_g263 [Closterium sp. NIES-67]